MSTLTTNYGMVKPALTDSPPDITVMGPNWDKLDVVLGATAKVFDNTSANDSYVITVPGISAQADLLGIPLKFKATIANTTACTLNVNGYGAYAINKDVSTALDTGDILVNSVVLVVWEGTQYQLMEICGIVNKTGTQTLTNKTLTAPKLGSGGFIADVNGNEILKTIVTVANAVNEVTVKNAATGGSVGFNATGGDANIDIEITPKGTGIVKVPSSATFGSRAAGIVGTNSFASGTSNVASGAYSSANGYQNTASGINANAEGGNSIASGNYSHSEGDTAQAIGYASHTEGQSTIAKGQDSHAEGALTKAYSNHSHAEGYGTQAGGSPTDASIGQFAHAEGQNTTASADYAHAEGYNNTASGPASHAEGSGNVVNNIASHVEGEGNLASGLRSHSEGYMNTASGNYSHAEGQSNQASGSNSHAGGYGGAAVGNQSFAHGNLVNAQGADQAVFGRCNVTDTTSLLIVGNGTSDVSRGNAFSVDNDGSTNSPLITEVIACGYLNASMTASRVGSTKQVKLHAATTQILNSNTWYTLCTLAGKYRPTVNLLKLILFANGSTGYLEIATTGVVNINPNALIPASTLLSLTETLI